MKSTIVIGSGFSGLSAAALLGSKGHSVTVIEKNQQVGGRARNFKSNGFTFDMGPSWYWMPEVFERFYSYFGKSSKDFYELVKLKPAFKVFFEDESVIIPNDTEQLEELFEKIEPGAGKQLNKFLNDAQVKYDIGINDILYKQPDGIKPFLSKNVIKSVSKLQLLTSITKHIKRYFKDPKLIQLLEFPVLFLGAEPKNTPALYSMMDYAGYSLGTWYPKGGFHEIIKAFKQICEENNVKIATEEEVIGFGTDNHKCTTVKTSKRELLTDSLVVGSDYHHFDQHISKTNKQYSSSYWESKVLAPSALLYFIGHDGIIDGLEHHNLFFDADFEKHGTEIYQSKSKPTNPLFYACCPSKTDESVAPKGKENLFILIPIAAGLENTEDLQDFYFDLVCERIKNKVGTDIRQNLLFRRNYSVPDFQKDYHSFKGNAYGLANTLNQTAFLKPRMKHKQYKNVFFTGQLTIPGPGVPPSIISGELAANYAHQYLSK